MLKGRDKVVEYLRFNNSPHWKIWNAQRTAIVSESPDEDNLTIDGSITKIEKVMDILGTGQFTLESWQTLNQKKDRFKITFELYGTGSETQQPAASIGAMPAPSSIQEMINKAIEDYQNKLKIETLEAKMKVLEAENKELQAESDNIGTRIYTRLEPLIGLLIPNQTSKLPATITGTENETFEEAQARMEKAFELWATKEPDPLLIVEKIAAMAINDPETYAMARSILVK